MAFDSNSGQASGPLNQANFVEKGTARAARVDLNGSKRFLIPANDRCRTEFVQPKSSCALDDGSETSGGVISQAN